MLRRTLLRVSTGIALRADGPVFRGAEASDKSGRYVDVRSFGAKGDGASDDAIPIQLAIDHAHSNTLWAEQSGL
jgi:Pectate lyase superfamily protein